MNIETEDVYKDIEANKIFYDTSDYPKDHPLHSTVNKKVLGKMKDECAGLPISEYVGLRSKMYSIMTEGESKKGLDKIKEDFPEAEIKEYLNVWRKEKAAGNMGNDKELVKKIKEKYPKVIAKDGVWV